jgi:hypothetical protein
MAKRTRKNIQTFTRRLATYTLHIGSYDEVN